MIVVRDIFRMKLGNARAVNDLFKEGAAIAQGAVRCIGALIDSGERKVYSVLL